MFELRLCLDFKPSTFALRFCISLKVEIVLPTLAQSCLKWETTKQLNFRFTVENKKIVNADGETVVVRLAELVES